MDADLLHTAFQYLATLPDFSAKRGVFLDIGANIGTASLAAIQRYNFATAVAIEPEPTNFELLQLNIRSNRLTDRIHAIQAAVSDKLGQVTLERSLDNFGDHRIRVPGVTPSNRGNLFAEDTRSTICVPSITLDALIEDNTIQLENLSLVWIDAQGHEGQILRGASALLRTQVPIVIEFWPYGLERAGGLYTLQELITTYYTHFVDIHALSSRPSHFPQSLLPTTAIAKLPAHYLGKMSTDLLLLTLPQSE
jgi:FkbM family methyltransferase